MRVKYHRIFEKKFKKLPKKLQYKVNEAIERFKQNPFDPKLRNHSLKWDIEGKRAFWVTGNYRIIFEEYNNYVLVLMLDVGSHPQVY